MEENTESMSKCLIRLLGLTKSAADRLGESWSDTKFHWLSAMAYTEGAANWQAQATGDERRYGPPQRDSYRLMAGTEQSNQPGRGHQRGPET